MSKSTHLAARDNPLAPACGSMNGRITQDATQIDCVDCIETMTVAERKALLLQLQEKMFAPQLTMLRQQ